MGIPWSMTVNCPFVTNDFVDMEVSGVRRQLNYNLLAPLHPNYDANLPYTANYVQDWFKLYRKAVVKSAKITVTFTNTDPDSACVAGLVTANDPNEVPLITDRIEDLQLRKGARYRFLQARDSGKSMATLSKVMSVYKWFRIPRRNITTDHRFIFEDGKVPSHKFIVSLFAGSEQDGTNPLQNVEARIRISYNIMFFEPRPQIQNTNNRVTLDTTNERLNDLHQRIDTLYNKVDNHDHPPPAWGPYSTQEERDRVALLTGQSVSK